MLAVCLLEKLPEQSKLTCNLASPSKSSTLTRLHTAMAGYHCTISCESCDRCCELPLLPLKAKQEALEGSRDVVEEAVFFFRANVLFTNYSIKSSADKLLVYITLFLSSCLKRLSDSKPCREEAEKQLFTLAHETFRLPGEFGFCLGGLVSAPINRQEADRIKLYLRQCRERAGRCLLERCYTEDGTLDKFWTAFASRRFLNKTMS